MLKSASIKAGLVKIVMFPYAQLEGCGMPSELGVVKTLERIQGVGKVVTWVVEAKECCAGPVSSWPS